MIARLIFGLIVLLGIAFAYRRWRASVNEKFAFFWDRLWKFLFGPRFCRVAETFCNEVAVLWFVFPLLDSLYQPRQLDMRLVREGFGVSAVFFIFAVVLSQIAGSEGEA